MSVTEEATGRGLARWHTYREAMSQPKLWRSWAVELSAQAEEIASWLAAADYDEIWFCGAGTSAFIGETLATYLNSMPGQAKYRAIPTTDLVSCPGNYIRSNVRVLVISFGRSGDSPETVGTMDLLDAHAPTADRLNFTCNAAGILAVRQAVGPGRQRTLLMPPESDDKGFAMTSSYSTMLLSALACLDHRPPFPVVEAIDRLATAGETVLSRAVQLAADVGTTPPSRAVFLGSGVLLGSARECALKVLELSAGRIPTSWDSTLGFRHGPKAVVNDTTRVHLMISSDSHTRRYDLDAANEIRAQFGPASIVTLGAMSEGVDFHVPVVGNDAWTSVLFVAAAQIQAIVWSDMLGMNVDNPFSASTLTRVVQGVPLYPFARG
jgi:fructoselysine-6-P-deglycase FrlB-like protein